MAGWQMTVCDVCRLVDGDISPKMCFYCKFCDSQICMRDMNLSDWTVARRRIQAAAMRKWETFRGVFA